MQAAPLRAPGLVLLSVLVATLSGCEDGGGGAPSGATAPAKKSAAPAASDATGAPKSAAADPTQPAPSPSASTAAAPSASAASPTGGSLSADGYPLDGVKTIPESCATPWAIFSTTKKGVFGVHHWPMADQAFHAHPQFKSIPGKPSAPGEVRFQAFDVDPKRAPDTIVLVTECADASTCNRVGAMYKAVVPSGHMELVCAPTVPGTVGQGTVMVLSPKLLDDVPFKCARVAVCLHKLDRGLSEDQHLKCQKSPSAFKLDCAKKESCDSIVACAK